MKRVVALFIDEKLDLSRIWVFILEKILKFATTCWVSWSFCKWGLLKKVRFHFQCQKRIYSLPFLFLPIAFESYSSKQKTLFITFFLYIYTFFTIPSLHTFHIFLLDKYKETNVQRYRYTKDSWYLLIEHF